MDHSFLMRDPRPSLAYRLTWLVPPAGIFLFALALEGPRIFDFEDIGNTAGGVGMFVYFSVFAWGLARDALKRRSI